jgi:hypothetical protein
VTVGAQLAALVDHIIVVTVQLGQPAIDEEPLASHRVTLALLHPSQCHVVGRSMPQSMQIAASGSALAAVLLARRTLSMRVSNPVAISDLLRYRRSNVERSCRPKNDVRSRST